MSGACVRCARRGQVLAARHAFLANSRCRSCSGRCARSRPRRTSRQSGGRVATPSWYAFPVGQSVAQRPCNTEPERRKTGGRAGPPRAGPGSRPRCTRRSDRSVGRILASHLLVWPSRAARYNEALRPPPYETGAAAPFTVSFTTLFISE